jgi:superfamily II DNA or RNA helicase
MSKAAWSTSNLLLEQNDIRGNTLIISKANEVYMKVDAEPVIRQELSDYFTFTVPGAKFMPAYRNRMWDGKMRLYNAMTKELYLGLLPYVQHFADEREYEVEVENDIDLQESFSLEEANEFIGTLQTKFTPRDYQTESFAHCVRNHRSLLVSPTASGKSFIIWLLTQWYGDSKTLLIVPTTSLVHQMRSDFIEYGSNEDDIHIIMSGQEKMTDARIVVSTWQSIYKLRKDWFAQYDLVIGDECHLFKAKSLTSIMTKLIDCKYRFGFTGTLDGAQTHKLVLEGLFGKVKQFVKTRELIDQNHLAKFKIKALVLKYTDEEKKLVSKMNYQDEIDFIVTNPRRNKFIKNLTLSLNGNTLLLFQYVDKHGRVLYNNISKSVNSNRKVFFVYGGTDAETREQIRAITETEKDAIIIASYGTFSTGINIRNLHNIIFASPTKSRIRNLQSIGRGLRKGESKDKAILFDIADDIRHKKKVNYTLNHFAERIKIYNDEEFEYKIYNINL